VATATVGELRAVVSLNGELRATDQVDVVAGISSRIVRLPVTVGQAVGAGQVLAELDRTELEMELAKAQTSLTKVHAEVAKLRDGSTSAEDIATEEASLRAAEARLAQLMQGPAPEDVDSAAQDLSQARNNRASTVSELALSKEQARLSMEMAAESLRAAQANYGAVKLIYDEALRTGKDPNIPSCPDDNKNCRDLTDTKLRQFKASFESSEIALKMAEHTLASRRLAYEDARRQEIAGLQVADSQVQAAAVNLEAARRGPNPDEVAEAEAPIVEARANLAKAQKAPYEEADLQIKQADVQSAEMDVREAELNLRDAQVVAPFAGIVAQRHVSVGSAVSASTTIVQLISQTIQVQLSADDGQVMQLEPGQRADVRLTAYPDVVFPARIEAISPTSSTTSRTFSVTLSPEAPDARLKPGMLAQADVAISSRPAVLMIPEQAVLARATENAVFVVADGKAKQTPVTLGARGGGMVEVLNGLKEGDNVVLEGQATLKDNDAVTVAG
jgi:RND family efflux transporter MFP subunit